MRRKILLKWKIRTAFELGQDLRKFPFGQFRPLAQHAGAVGEHGTIDIARDYLDDTRMDLPLPARPGLRSTGRGFRRWLQRLLPHGGA